MLADPRHHRTERGFTLLELLIVVTILATIAGIGVPHYVGALRTARIAKARHELITISHAIDSYAANNGGYLPLSLNQVGFGGRNDPWGTPYCYLNYRDGTGDGLDWAMDAGIVDPAAFAPIESVTRTVGDTVGDVVDTVDDTVDDVTDAVEDVVEGVTDILPGSGGSGGGLLPGGGGGGLLPGGGGGGLLPGGGGGGGDGGHALAAFRVPQEPAVQLDLQAISTSVGRVLSLTERLALESAVKEVGEFSFFRGVQVETTRRRDRYMFPLNTDYDLFSLGPDHATAVSLGESVGHDDVIRANNGGYFGPASQY